MTEVLYCNYLSDTKYCCLHNVVKRSTFIPLFFFFIKKHGIMNVSITNLLNNLANISSSDYRNVKYRKIMTEEHVNKHDGFW